jgi:hypothetical protein
MTTFTLQDLNLPATVEQAEQALQRQTAYRYNATTEEWMEHGMNNPISTSALEYAKQHDTPHATQHAPEPQPALCESTQTDLPTIIRTISDQLLALATVISQSKAQPEDNQSLQECIATTLQQADWFKELVAEQVEERVESEVESYFSHSFDPTDHYDFGDAVSDCVSDQIDDVVSDKIDEAVDAYLSNATISISK